MSLTTPNAETMPIMVKRYREQYGLSQAAMARHCGISKPTYASVENRTRYPHGETLDRIAEALTRTPDGGIAS